MDPRETLEAFDRYLADRQLRLDAVVIGGAALNLLGIISRATKTAMCCIRSCQPSW
jgi:hypothetical protein